MRPVGFFFKPIATTDIIAYTSQNAAYLFDLGARREQRIPGTVDPVPTPDGKFLTRPGLMFYPVPTLAAGDTIPVFIDRELPDEYQTISILKQSRDAVRYRVVTGWRMGVRLREYDVTFATRDKPVHIEPLGTPMVPCAGRGFSLPISAKGSREVGVFDKDSRTNRVIEIGEDGRCTDVLDLGFASGKLSFNYDASAIAFATSRIDVDAEGFMLQPEEAFYKDALHTLPEDGPHREPVEKPRPARYDVPGISSRRAQHHTRSAQPAPAERVHSRDRGEVEKAAKRRASVIGTTPTLCNANWADLNEFGESLLAR